MKDKNGNSTVDNEGVLFLVDKVDGSKSENICKQIIQLNLRQEQPFIQLIVNCQGGYCTDGFAIIDMMEWSQIPVFTTGIGMVASMGLLIFMAGEKGHRVLTPRTSILSHRYAGFAMGKHSELVAKRVEEDLMHQRIINHYMQHSKLKLEEELNQKVLNDVDTWLTPAQAIEYGLADMVQSDVKTPYPNYTLQSLAGGAR